MADLIIRKCIRCGKEFEVKKFAYSNKHCSYQCRFLDVADAFLLIDGCWEWPLSRNPQTGYGQMNVNYSPTGVHRISYEVFNGPINDGLMVCHTCDNRGCFNPKHLFVGTQKDNMEDMTAKGRGRKNPNRGSKHHMAKLTENQIIEILNMGGKYKYIASAFGISETHVCSIKKNRVWKHVRPTVEQLAKKMNG